MNSVYAEIHELFANRGSLIGKDIRYFDCISSTNETALALADRGCAEGTVVIADMQTGGKGRSGHTWHSPPGLNIYLSVIVYPHLSIQHTSLLTQLSGIACISAIRNHSRASLSLKWPNDIMAGGKKLGGILIETKILGSFIHCAIIGIGININSRECDFNLDLTDKATSLSIEEGCSMPRMKIAASILREIDRFYRKDLAKMRDLIERQWNNYAVVLNTGRIAGDAARKTAS